ncbi:hypothetical protein Salat_0440500 [Sesamum alatum]|uniref:Uncharacterized protein n=1 Tax=Sesamum alatum TaxID=300844 RepID=A0AAE1Z2V6_9LAMI|nr:hypothetical protein Salat_0440500 [Sesamum alatum]
MQRDFNASLSLIWSSLYAKKNLKLHLETRFQQNSDIGGASQMRSLVAGSTGSRSTFCRGFNLLSVVCKGKHKNQNAEKRRLADRQERQNKDLKSSSTKGLYISSHFCYKESRMVKNVAEITPSSLHQNSSQFKSWCRFLSQREGLLSMCPNMVFVRTTFSFE